MDAVDKEKKEGEEDAGVGMTGGDTERLGSGVRLRHHFE